MVEISIDGSRIKSYGIIAQPGTRITLATAASDEGWEDLPWRSVVVLDGTCFTSQKGNPAVQIPDCDAMDKWDATRTMAEGSVGYPEAPRLKDGTGWTYGRSRQSSRSSSSRSPSSLAAVPRV